ncbi:MAG: toll/interleukin-1 receptor domain-containing protein [Planctomycetaceae bacterium]
MTASTTVAKPRVAVSYAWKEERVGPNREAVERFCETLRGSGVEVVRDKDDAKYGDDLMRFMRDIGRTDSLCVFMSKAYLESFCCMYEFLVAWNRSLDNPDEFRSRVHIWLMEDARVYSEPGKRKPLVKKWQKRAKENKAYADELMQRGVLSPGTTFTINRMQQIHQEIDGMIDHATKHLSADSWDVFAESVCRRAGEAHKASTEEVFSNIVKGINQHLSCNPFVASFLHNVVPETFSANGLAPTAATELRGHDDGPGGVLEPIYRRLRESPFPSLENRRAMREICAGVVLLAVDPAWVMQERSMADVAHVGIPGAELVMLPPTPNNTARQASLLHLATAALVDSASRLKDVFTGHQTDGRRLDLPQKMPGIGQQEIPEIRKLIITKILGPQQASNLSDRESNASIEARYQKALKLMAKERNLYGTPYYSTDKKWLDTVVPVKSGELQLKDLLLLQPSPESERDLLPEMVQNLTLLWHIFDLLPLDP